MNSRCFTGPGVRKQSRLSWKSVVQSDLAGLKLQTLLVAIACICKSHDT